MKCNEDKKKRKPKALCKINRTNKRDDQRFKNAQNAHTHTVFIGNENNDTHGKVVAIKS